MPHWSKSKILLIDKDTYYRKLTLQMLREKSPGAVAETDGSGNDREFVSRYKPTLIILGISERDQSCLDLVHWLRSADVTPVPGVTVILMAVNISDDTVKRAIYAGVDYIITKPTSPRVLQERIDSLAKKPVPQANTKHYTGPDRRRLPADVYDGPERRQQSGVEDSAA